MLLQAQVKSDYYYFFCHYQSACFPSFPHKWLVGRWRGATTNASLCSSSRWVIYAWRWAPKAPPSLCCLPSARLGPQWDINPSQTPPPTPANKQTFSLFLFSLFGNISSVFHFNLSNGLISSSSFCPSLSLLSISYILAFSWHKIQFEETSNSYFDWFFNADPKHISVLKLLMFHGHLRPLNLTMQNILL